MSKQLVVHKGRTNVVALNVGFNITGETLTSEIRERPEQDSPLIATWTLTVVTPSTGECQLVLDDSITGPITHTRGFMDIKRLSGGQPIPLFDEPLAVEFRGSVTV